jgi:hypothetical protein
MKRSIEYRIKEEGKITRALFAANGSPHDVEKILEVETMIDLPKLDSESFIDFDNELKSNIEMMRKLVKIIIFSLYILFYCTLYCLIILFRNVSWCLISRAHLNYLKT